MIYIETGSTSPAVNLAFEEYFLREKNLGENCFMLWCNRPAVIVGRFQNTFEEINAPFIADRGIEVLRRISGGGAVYHDPGNLCFSFIITGPAANLFDKPLLARPMVEALGQMGLQVELSKRNDMLIDGKKFSGNAMTLTGQRLLYHGTLLFDSDLDTLTRALARPSAKIESKGTQSVRSTVTNLKGYLAQEMDMDRFKQALKDLLLKDGRVYEPNPRDLAAIEALAISKYQSWDWNMGGSPPSTLVRTCSFPGGDLEIHLVLEKGLIRQCRFIAEWADPEILKKIEARLIRVRYNDTDVQAALDPMPGATFPVKTFMHCLMGISINADV